jgi:hypothetical protein
MRGGLGRATCSTLRRRERKGFLILLPLRECSPHLFASSELTGSTPRTPPAPSSHECAGMARDLLGAVVGGRTVCWYFESGCEVAYYAQINNRPMVM